MWSPIRKGCITLSIKPDQRSLVQKLGKDDKM
jgi:hypothetical protein